MSLLSYTEHGPFEKLSYFSLLGYKDTSYHLSSQLHVQTPSYPSPFPSKTSKHLSTAPITFFSLFTCSLIHYYVGSPSLYFSKMTLHKNTNGWTFLNAEMSLHAHLAVSSTWVAALTFSWFPSSLPAQSSAPFLVDATTPALFRVSSSTLSAVCLPKAY